MGFGLRKSIERYEAEIDGYSSDLEEAAAKALRDVAFEALNFIRPYVPKDTRRLVKSSEVRQLSPTEVVIFWPVYYALIVHEKTEWNFNAGTSKFVEKGFADFRPFLGDFLAKQINQYL